MVPSGKGAVELETPSSGVDVEVVGVCGYAVQLY